MTMIILVTFCSFGVKCHLHALLFRVPFLLHCMFLSWVSKSDPFQYSLQTPYSATHAFTIPEQAWVLSQGVKYRWQAEVCLTVPGGHESHFPHFFLKFALFFFFLFSSKFLIFVLHLCEPPTRDGPDYATGQAKVVQLCQPFFPLYLDSGWKILSNDY